MDPHQIKEKILNTMSLVFEVPVDEINEDSSTDNVAHWDSLRQLNLILALEEEFKISIPDEEVGNMVNYKIVYYVVTDALKDGRN